MQYTYYLLLKINLLVLNATKSYTYNSYNDKLYILQLKKLTQVKNFKKGFFFPMLQDGS